MKCLLVLLLYPSGKGRFFFVLTLPFCVLKFLEGHSFSRILKKDRLFFKQGKELIEKYAILDYNVFHDD